MDVNSIILGFIVGLFVGVLVERFFVRCMKKYD
jgi:uncharacterized membrane-anchored protein YhcB (DUF1043 family)